MNAWSVDEVVGDALPSAYGVSRNMTRVMMKWPVKTDRGDLTEVQHSDIYWEIQLAVNTDASKYMPMIK
jgi:hypothetical protein